MEKKDGKKRPVELMCAVCPSKPAYNHLQPGEHREDTVYWCEECWHEYRGDEKSGWGRSSSDSRRAPVLRVVRSREEYSKEKAHMLTFERFRYYGSVISLESWGIFGKRKGLKGEETKEAEGPGEGMVLVDPIAKEDATSETPLKERKGLSLQIYKWLGISGVQAFLPRSGRC